MIFNTENNKIINLSLNRITGIFKKKKKKKIEYDVLHLLYKQCQDKMPDIFYLAHVYSWTNNGHNS